MKILSQSPTFTTNLLIYNTIASRAANQIKTGHNAMRDTPIRNFVGERDFC